MASREELVIYIEGLQATLAKRNVRIKELEGQLSDELESPVVQRKIRKAYKEGWEGCAGTLMELTRQTARKLGEVNARAWDSYLQGEVEERKVIEQEKGANNE